MCFYLSDYLHFVTIYHKFHACFSTLLSISFILASMNGSLDVARILVENGADVNKVDKIRKSSLMVRFIGKQKMP